MCELCDGTFERIENPAVIRAAEMAKRVEPYGAMHIIVDDCNVDDEDIEFCLKLNDCNDADRAFAQAMMPLTYQERVSAIALADGLWKTGRG